MTVVQFIVVLFVYPETKGQTLEALQRRLVPARLGFSNVIPITWVRTPIRGRMRGTGVPSERRAAARSHA